MAMKEQQEMQSYDERVMNYSRQDGGEYSNPDHIIKEEDIKIALDPDYDLEDEIELESEDEVIEVFLANKSIMETYWDAQYRAIENDWDVYTLDQWTESTKTARDGRPSMTVDISGKYVQYIVGETYKNPPGIKLEARRDDATPKARIMSEAVRYFENRCGAIHSYAFAKEMQAALGLGWIKYTYCEDPQEKLPYVVEIDKVDDVCSIMMDPDGGVTGANAQYMMEIHGRVDGEEQFTYWWKNEERIVQWALLNGDSELIDRGVFPGNWIPLVPVFGKYYRMRDKTKTYGLTRMLKDNQRAYNYTLSEAVERIALTPKTQTYAARGSLTDEDKRDIEDSTNNPRSVIEYDAIALGGEGDQMGFQAPQRANTTPDTAWVPLMLQQLQANAKEITGIHDTAMGDIKGNTAGIAINKLTDNSDRGHVMFDDHFMQSISHGGKIVLGLLDTVVGEAGIIPTLSEEGKVMMHKIGQPQEAMGPNGEVVYGPPLIEDLDPSDLDISISTGKSYGTRKTEGHDVIVSMLPQLVPEDSRKLIPEIIRGMDFPGADTYAEILAPEGEMNPQALASQNAEMKAMLEQQEAQLAEATQANATLSMQLNTNTQAMLQAKSMDTNSKRELKIMDIQGNLAETRMELEAKAQSDDKKIAADQMGKAVDTQVDYAKIQNDNMQLNAKIDADADADDKKIMADAIMADDTLNEEIASSVSVIEAPPELF